MTDGPLMPIKARDLATWAFMRKMTPDALIYVEQNAALEAIKLAEERAYRRGSRHAYLVSAAALAVGFLLGYLF